MSMKTRSFDFSVKNVTKRGAFSGYISVYGVTDSYREKVAPGAASESIAGREAAGRRFPILFQHDQSQPPIGAWTKLTEDDHGIHGEGELWLDDSPTARIVHRGLTDGAIDGLSIGYYEDTWTYDEESRVKTLTKIHLVEASIVITPANDAARIDQVKAKVAAGEDVSIREFEAFLREKGGWSRSQAEEIAAFGFKRFARRESGDVATNAASLVDALRGLSLPKI